MVSFSAKLCVTSGRQLFQLIEHNDDYVVVNKAPGISVQADGEKPGLLQVAAKALGFEKLYPVHRLDKMTSGVVIMAVTPSANSQLSALFRNRAMEKYYLALSDAKPRKKQGAVIGDMSKARRGAWKLLSSRENPAVTQFFCTSLVPKVRLFVIKPHTGKTHQIRVALRSLGAPIIGDPLYHVADQADRGYLHAYCLRFEWQGTLKSYQCLPASGELFSNTAFTEVMKNYREPWALPWPKL